MGRNVSVPNERSYSAAIASMSCGRAASDHPRTLRAMPRDRNEPVRLTKIYTRGGDTGETSLGDGSRAPKLDLRIAAYGIVDELNSQLGVVLAAADLPETLRPCSSACRTSSSTSAPTSPSRSTGRTSAFASRSR